MPTMTKDSQVADLPLISRKEAADLLSVSVRTIDRYIERKLLSSEQKGRQVYLYQDQIYKLAADASLLNETDEHNEGQETIISPELDEDPSFLNVSSRKDNNAISADSSIMHFDFKKEANIYKELYFDLRDELKDSQKRLESANYRVGQLETQVQNTVPLLELSKKENEMEKKEQSIIHLENSIQRERTLKIILLCLLAVLLLIEPIAILIQMLIQSGS